MKTLQETSLFSAPYGTVVHRKFKPLSCDEQYARIMGFDGISSVMAVDSLLDFISLDESKRAQDYYDALLNGDQAPAIQLYHNRNALGEPIILLTLDKVVHWNNELAMQVVIVDVTCCLHRQIDIAQEWFHYQQMINGAPQGVLVIREQELVFCNDAFARLFGYSPDAKTDIIDVSSLFHESWLPKLQEEAQLLYQGKKTEVAMEAQGIKVDGSPVWVFLMGRRIIWAGKEALHVTATDMTNEYLLRKNLEHKASIDTLTKVLNRSGLEDRIQKLLSTQDEIHTCVLMDLNRFKQINDNYGHLVGDAYLKHFARVCKEAIRGKDIFGRWGGDEFVLILHGVNESAAIPILKRLKGILKVNPMPFVAGNIAMDVAWGSVDTSEVTPLIVDTLLAKADKALYQHKNSNLLGR